MRRHGNLWPQVTDLANIEVAYDNAARGKRWQRTVQRVEKRKDEALAEVQQMLVSHTFTTAQYRTKKVYIPKERTIYVLPFFPDRIVQHAVMSVVAPIWNNTFDESAHACRPGKGQHTASRATMHYVRRYRYVLQADVRKFYPSLNHDVVMGIIEQKIKDPDVLWLLDDIIRSFPGEVNVPIGNLTSQWIGNLVLNALDRFVKDKLKPCGYVRYNDDMLLFADDRDWLLDTQEQCREFLRRRLCLTMSKERVYPVSTGVDFVGYRHFPEYVLIRKSTAKRMKQRIARLRYEIATEQIEPDRARSVVASIYGWLRWANAHNFARSLSLDELQEAIGAQIQRLREGGQAA